LNKITLLTFILLSTSCIKEVDYLAPPFTSQLVLSAIINPDAVIKAHVGKTIAITDTSSSMVENASVFVDSGAF
jgi:hypothetical protein